MRRQKIFIGLCLSFSLLFIYSCSSREKTSAVREIEFMNWEYSPEGMRFMDSLIREFEKKNPAIRVKNVIVSGDGYFSKLLTRFGAGVPPDIFEIQAEMIHPFLKKRLLLNLSPYIGKSAVLNEEDFFPISLVNFRYDGERFRTGDLYGLPKDFGTAALIYNKDLFDKEGLSYPDETWTEKEYLDAAAKITKRDSGDRIIQIGIDRSIQQLYILLDKGGSIWSPDYKECLLDSAAGIEAYQFVYDLQEVHRVALSVQAVLKEGLGESVGFKTGKAGMSMIWRFELPDLRKYISDRFKWDVASLPSFNGRNIQFLHGPSGWSISKDTKYPEDCIRFMEFMVGETGQVETAKIGWNIPGNKKIAYSDYFLQNLNRDDSERINRLFLRAIDTFDGTLLNPYIPINRVNTIIDEELDPNIIRKYGGHVEIPLRKAVKRINQGIAENPEGNAE